jgi:hypothetical protein
MMRLAKQVQASKPHFRAKFQNTEPHPSNSRATSSAARAPQEYPHVVDCNAARVPAAWKSEAKSCIE